MMKIMKLVWKNIIELKHLRIYLIFHYSEAVLEKGVFENFAKFTEKYLCQILSFHKVAGPVEE